MYICVGFTKGRHVLEAMCEGALMAMGDCGKHVHC